MSNISRKNYEYHQYNDYAFRTTVEKRANGVLKFLKIPYKIDRMILSEVTNIGPKIHRLDFAGEVKHGDERFCIILECQTNLPTEDDILRFFQYVSSLRVLQKKKVELYILCIKKAPYAKKDFVINDNCTYTMHMISLKNINAHDIFKRIENKINSNQEINDEDIAALQLIVYTKYNERPLEILKKAHALVERIELELNEKLAIQYLLNVLSANMLNEKDKKEYFEVTNMMLNPHDEYLKNKGIEEGMKKGMKKVAKSLKGTLSPEEIAKHTGLTIEEINSL